MSTLKTVVVLAVLAIVGYGLYVGLNNGFEFQADPPPLPDWIAAQTGGAPNPPSVQFGSPEDSPTPVDMPAPRDAPGAVPGTPPSGPGDGAASPGAAPSATDREVPPGTAVYPNPAPPGSQTPPDFGSSAARGTAAQQPKPGAAAGSSPLLNSLVGTNPGPPAVDSTAPGQPPDAQSSLLGDRYPNSIPDSLRQPATPDGAETPAGAPSAFATSLAAARHQLDSGQLSAALLSLSVWYEDPRLQPDEQQQLVQLLDQVAGSVIYSRKHLLESAYRATAGETLADVAGKFQVSPGLLAKINGIAESAPLAAGQELKVVRGPFNAVLDSKKGVMTLWVGGRYAGRFPVTVGPEFDQIVGPFVVQDKVRTHAGNGGHAWISLGPGFQPVAPSAGAGSLLGIAGMNTPEELRQGTAPGRIGVSVTDGDDLYDILSQGSKVTIRR